MLVDRVFKTYCVDAVAANHVATRLAAAGAARIGVRTSTVECVVQADRVGDVRGVVRHHLRIGDVVTYTSKEVV